MKKVDILKKYPEIRKSLKKIQRGSLYKYILPHNTFYDFETKRSLILITHFYNTGIRVKVLASEVPALMRDITTITYGRIDYIKEEVPLKDLPLYMSQATPQYKEYLKTIDLDKALS